MINTVVLKEEPVALSTTCILPYTGIVFLRGETPVIWTEGQYRSLVESIARYSVHPVVVSTDSQYLGASPVHFSFRTLEPLVLKYMCHPAQAFLISQNLPAMHWIPELNRDLVQDDDSKLVAAIDPRLFDELNRPALQIMEELAAENGWECLFADSYENFQSILQRVLSARYVITANMEFSLLRAGLGKTTFSFHPPNVPVVSRITPWDRFVVVRPDVPFEDTIEELFKWPECL